MELGIKSERLGWHINWQYRQERDIRTKIELNVQRKNNDERREGERKKERKIR